MNINKKDKEIQMQQDLSNMSVKETIQNPYMQHSLSQQMTRLDLSDLS